ncbi:MAG: hypothetical protein WAO01_20960, partial [Bradyrhizobium sp.]
VPSTGPTQQTRQTLIKLSLLYSLGGMAIAWPLRSERSERYTKLTRDCNSAKQQKFWARGRFKFVATPGVTEIRSQKTKRPALIAMLDCDMSPLSQENNLASNL